MGSRGEYFQKLHDDLSQQFKGKPNIVVFQKAMAKQLDELYAFFYALRTMRRLQDAEGVQLDGIGNIVGMSRTEALIWSNLAGLVVPMDDKLYRMYLWFKIFLNTSDGTYADVARTIAKFWPDTPFYYSERIDAPATMFFTSEPMPITTDLRVLGIASKAKSAGVSLHLVMRAEENKTSDFYTSAASGFMETYVFEWPALGGRLVNSHAAAASLFAEPMLLDNPELGGHAETDMTASANIFMETRVLE